MFFDRENKHDDVWISRYNIIIIILSHHIDNHEVFDFYESFCYSLDTWRPSEINNTVAIINTVLG